MIARDLKRFSIAGFFFAALGMTFPAGPAWAPRLQPLRPGDFFAPVTLLRGESLRINVASLGSYSSVAPRFPAKVLVMFVDQNGEVLNGNGRGEVLALLAGHSASVQYYAINRNGRKSAASAKGVSAGEGIIRAEVFSFSGQPSAVQSSLEILDASGRTTQVLRPVTKFIQNPRPSPK